MVADGAAPGVTHVMHFVRHLIAEITLASFIKSVINAKRFTSSSIKVFRFGFLVNKVDPQCGFHTGFICGRKKVKNSVSNTFLNFYLNGCSFLIPFGCKM